MSIFFYLFTIFYIVKLSIISFAAFFPASIANITVAAPVTASPPANTFFIDVFVPATSINPLSVSFILLSFNASFSELKIIEISIKTEKDIENLFSDGFLSENLNKRIGNKIEFISFKRNIEEKLISPISRFIYLPTIRTNPFFCDFKCDIANYKLIANSVIELNIINSKHQHENNNYTIACNWLAKHIEFKRCNICKFYYKTTNNEEFSCRLSTKYDKPIFPMLEYAEKCSWYQKNTFSFNEDEYKILEIKENNFNKKGLYVLKYILFYLMFLLVYYSLLFLENLYFF